MFWLLVENMKILLTDLETTGLIPGYNEIIEIGAVLFDEDTFIIEQTFEEKVHIEHPERIDPEAQKVNGYNEDEWGQAVSLYEALETYAGLTKGARFCSQNIIFDWGFLVATDFPSFHFDHHKIELSSLAYAKIPHNKMQSWSLRSICSYLDIKPEPKVHRALNGALTGYEVFKKLMR